MSEPIRHLDQRFDAMRPLLADPRPSSGWVRAIRKAMGMKTRQFAQRLGVSQPRITELEQAEATGNVTLHTLERAAAALGCRLIYALIPERPLAEIMGKRAREIALRKLTSVEHTMRLEDQAVENTQSREDMLRRLTDQILQQPSQLWNEE